MESDAPSAMPQAVHAAANSTADTAGTNDLIAEE
jgi:hypothetical protein